jgi:hypothetical protein
MDGRVYLVCFAIPNGFGNTTITIRKRNFTELELLDDITKELHEAVNENFVITNIIDITKIRKDSEE